MRLYHGSKAGIEGPIRPISRDRCDFGAGFYMGTDKLQQLTLVCEYETPYLYTLDFDMDGLSILELPSDLDWALYIAYNRGKLDAGQSPALFEHVSSLAAGCDVISGKIANDRMFVVLDQFFNGTITDSALIACLEALDIGTQYVAKTQRACNHVHIVEAHELDADERAAYTTQSRENRKVGIARADAICREHRRDGRFFDEILQEWTV